MIHEVYIEKSTILPMPGKMWKCFRCDLSFKDEEHAKIHNEITSHDISVTKSIIA